MTIKCTARQITPISVVTHCESVLVGDGILISLYHERFAYRIQKSAAQKAVIIFLLELCFSHLFVSLHNAVDELLTLNIVRLKASL